MQKEFLIDAIFQCKYRKVFSFFCLILLLMNVNAVFANNKIDIDVESAAIDIRGTVSSTAGEPLEGVTVTVKGSSVGTTTDTNGQFSISVPSESSVLVVSFIGFITQEVTVGNTTQLNIHLVASASDLEDVVVVGYGTRRKSDLTGAVGTVRSDALSERPAASLNQNLSGRITGVNVSSSSGRPGGRANIRIRGNTSISVANDPLYVIDGVILNSAGLQNGSTPIDYMNPNDIQSIEVLKDASSTAIYGARGANGVILVTTKRGSSGGGKLTYDSDFSIGVAPKKLAVLNSKEFFEVEDLAYANAQKYDPQGWADGKYVDPKTKRNDPLLFDANGNNLYETDWQDETFRKAFTQNHQLGFTGGNEKGSYGGFLNYRDENGIVTGSWIKRYAARFVFDSQIKSWLKVGGSLGYTDQTDRQIDILGGGGITPMRQVLEALPFIPVKYPNGAWGRNRDYPGMEGGDSPLRVIEERSYFLRTQTLLGNMFANIKLAEGLELRSTLGTNIINQRLDNYNGRDLQYISSNGNAVVNNNRFNSWQFENYLTYNKSFGAHNINAMAGISWQHVDRYEMIARSQNYFDNFFGVNNLGIGSIIQAPSSVATAYGLQSYFGRVNYTLLNKYLVTITGRQDGSSKFGINNRYAFFPSAALAWKVTEEDFMKAIPTISNLKIRTSYGETGNSEINAYQADEIMFPYEVIFANNREIGIGVGRMGNPSLKWEKVRQFDFGLELGLFNNRINLEFDWYKKTALDMLLSAPVPRSSAYTDVSRNIGSMENKGIELAINSVNISTNNFSWNTTFNISINKNKVIALTGGSPIYSGNTIIQVGQPVGSFFGRVNLGTWGSHEASVAERYGWLPGDVKYADLNGDSTINDLDRTIIGKGIPDGFGSFINTFQYKNWSLMIDLQYMYGNDVLDRSLHSAEDRQGIANSYKTVLNAWTETNQNTPIAQIRPIPAGYDTNNDSHKVTDASFLRGRNLLLSYTFNPDVAKRLYVDRIRVFASVQNFFVATKYRGYDPEVSNSGSPFDQGFGLYDYPRPRVFMLGINVGL